MKKLLNSLLIFIAFSFVLTTTTQCKKEKIVYQYIKSDSGNLYLLGIRTLNVTSTKARVVIDFVDLDSSATTQYSNTLFNIEINQTQVTLSPSTIKKAVYDNVILEDYYRHTTSIYNPSQRTRNDKLVVEFRIGTMGDVYVSTER